MTDYDRYRSIRFICKMLGISPHNTYMAENEKQAIMMTLTLNLKFNSF